jgi:hypothetical protein
MLFEPTKDIENYFNGKSKDEIVILLADLYEDCINIRNRKLRLPNQIKNSN